MRLGADDPDLAEEVLSAYDAFNAQIEPPSLRARILARLILTSFAICFLVFGGLVVHIGWRLFLFGWNLL